MESISRRPGDFSSAGSFLSDIAVQETVKNIFSDAPVAIARQTPESIHSLMQAETAFSVERADEVVVALLPCSEKGSKESMREVMFHSAQVAIHSAISNKS